MSKNDMYLFSDPTGCKESLTVGYAVYCEPDGCKESLTVGYAVYCEPEGSSFVLPDFTTSGTLTPRSWAIKPRIEKITNPAKKLVRQLPIVTIIVSLCERTHALDK